MAWTETRGGRHRGMFRDLSVAKRGAGWADSKKEAKALAQTKS